MTTQTPSVRGFTLPSYERPRGLHPPLDSPGYRSTELRAPRRPLVARRHRDGAVEAPLGVRCCRIRSLFLRWASRFRQHPPAGKIEMRVTIRDVTVWSVFLSAGLVIVVVARHRAK